jgi:hypothetical protein
MFRPRKERPIEWFIRNREAPLFSHAEVLELAENRIPHDTLQNWANRKYIEPMIEGGKRRYRPQEVATVILANPLVQRLGMDPSNANAAMAYTIGMLFRRFKITEAKRQIAVYRHIAVYEDIDVALGDERATARQLFNEPPTDEPGQPPADAFAVVPIGRLLDALASKMRKRVEERGA